MANLRPGEKSHYIYSTKNFYTECIHTFRIQYKELHSNNSWKTLQHLLYFLKRYTNTQWEIKEKVNKISHQGNAYKNQSEILLKICRMA
jgi:hypothetical protein